MRMWWKDEVVLQLTRIANALEKMNDISTIPALTEHLKTTTDALQIAINQQKKDK